MKMAQGIGRTEGRELGCLLAGWAWKCPSRVPGDATSSQPRIRAMGKHEDILQLCGLFSVPALTHKATYKLET